MKKLWKYRRFRTAAVCVCLTVLGLSFSLAGRRMAEPAGPGGVPAVLTAEPPAGNGEAPERGAETASTAGAPDRTEAESAAPETPALLHVYVCGAVNRPEVYVLPEGSRVTDAVRAAGGFSEDAAQDARNLAELLTDGEMIDIPSEEEWAAARMSGGNGTGGDRTDAAAGKPARESGKTADGRIDLNSADAETLMSLPGIGESKAKRIIAWREQNGPFRRTEDLMQIPGIKESTYHQLKDQITAE